MHEKRIASHGRGRSRGHVTTQNGTRIPQRQMKPSFRRRHFPRSRRRRRRPSSATIRIVLPGRFRRVPSAFRVLFYFFAGILLGLVVLLLFLSAIVVVVVVCFFFSFVVQLFQHGHAGNAGNSLRHCRGRIPPRRGTAVRERVGGQDGQRVQRVGHAVSGRSLQYDVWSGERRVDEIIGHHVVVLSLSSMDGVRYYYNAA
mmetsp:Transcript_27538/g.57207  ORF Transcript_27538/g.57207 Transcript_27538/m.57207 type:complete len:200 (-) Transcript_27538:92-691(-)